MKLFIENFVKLADKSQDELTVNYRIDTRVECPAEMHVCFRLHLLPHRRFWAVTKFADSIHMIYQAQIRSITFILTRHID